MKPSPSPAQLRALTRAAERNDGAICPIFKVTGYAEESLIESLVRRGWVVDSATGAAKAYGDFEGVPVITDAGRAVVAKDGCVRHEA